MTNPVDFSYDLTYKFLLSYGEEGLVDYAPMEDGPHQCVCLPGFTPILDEDDNLVECFDCREIDLDCVQCSTKDTCELCGTEDRILSPDGTHCVDKLYGCKVKFESQPDNLWIKEDKDGHQFYMCPECKEGYFWNTELRRCRPCNTSHFGLDHCTSCPTE